MFESPPHSVETWVNRKEKKRKGEEGKKGRKREREKRKGRGLKEGINW